MKKNKFCSECGVDISEGHKNRKYCEECAVEKRRRPRHNLNDEQVRIVNKLAGRVKRSDICKQANCSLSSLKRYAGEVGLSLHAGDESEFRYPAQVIEKVCRYYEKHGRPKTERKFPGVKVRSIVERHQTNPRLIPWTDQDMFELVKMAGIVSNDNQARYFSRPNAGRGSIVSVWQKRFGYGQYLVNGLPKWKAKMFVDANCPCIISEQAAGKNCKKVYLWVDMIHYLKDDCPEFIKEAIKVMANFQRWIFGGDDVRKEIRKIRRAIARRKTGNGA